MSRKLRSRAVLLSALAGAAVLAAAAPGQTPAPAGAARMEPNVAGKGAKLIVDLVPPAQKETPTSVVLAIGRGFKFDRKARKRRCTPQQATNMTCPAKSRIGGGSVQVTAKSILLPGGSQTFTAQIQSFLAPPPQAGDKAGIVIIVSEPTTGVRRSSTARLVKLGPGGAFGYEIRFESLPTMTLPLGVTVKINRFLLRIGAKRKVKKRRRKANGKIVIKRKRHYLIRNPKTCTGSWPYELRLTFPSGPKTYAGQLACTPAP